MGELEVSDCIYCGETISALPSIQNGENGDELVYYCSCGETIAVKLRTW